MTVREIFVAGQSLEVSGAGYEPHGEYLCDGSPVEPPEALLEALRAAVLASDAQVVRDDGDGRWHVRGDPTEGALLVAAS
jgi:Ca2+-transporting ATPase